MTFPILDIEKSSVEKYLSNMVQDSNHRFKSWEYCYTAFGNLDSVDYLSLHLAFYLASWGMYRGSCGILWKDYTIHMDAVNIIRKFHSLRKEWFTMDDVSQIMKLYNALKDYYSKITYYKPENKTSSLNLAATDTLITKIMLGTIGCVPASDDLFKRAFHCQGKQFDEELLKRIIDCSQSNKDTIQQCQRYISEKLHYHYPSMKVVDMCFWQKGFDDLKNRVTKNGKIR